MSEIFVGRQPIFDIEDNTYAYELLYRSSAKAQACMTEDLNGAAATIANAILDTGLKRITQNKLAFVNCTRDFLLGEDFRLLPAQQVVLEILENIEPDAKLLDVLQRARDDGYRFALDDFVYAPQYAPLLAFADIIKMDFRLQSPEEIARDLQKFPDFKGQLLAEKIETHEELEIAKELGFHFFQGYFFARPKTLTTQALPASALQSLRNLASADQASLESLEDIFNQDVSASLRLLRYVNSAALSLPTEIQSIRHAARLVGIMELRRILKMVSVAGLAAEAPVELLLLSLTRAQFCAAFAKTCAIDEEAAFSLGLLSLLDALLGRSMPSILDEFPFNQDVKDALLGEKNRFSVLLEAAQAFAHGDLETIALLSAPLAVSSQTLALHYIEAIESAHLFFRESGVIK